MPDVTTVKGKRDELHNQTEFYYAPRGKSHHVCVDLGYDSQNSTLDILLRRSSPSPQETPPQLKTCSALKELHLTLLDLEHTAGIERLEQQASLGTLKRLLVTRTERTPHGLRLWILRLPGSARQPLPQHNIRAREPVWATREIDNVSQRAVVYQVTDFEMALVMNDDDKLTLNQVVEVHRVGDDVMHWRLRGVVEGLDHITGRASRLREELFAERPLESAEGLPMQLTSASGELQLFNTRLDSFQREAVEFALRQKHLAVIHGPPGTGKTITLVEIILQHLRLGCRVLACASSNTAVDNLLERLAEEVAHHLLCLRMVRLGHPARIRESLLDFWVDKVAGVLYDNDTNGRYKMPSMVRKQQVNATIEASQVVLCTLASTSKEGPLGPPRRLGLGAFDLVVIDECSQSVEAACWLAAQRSGKLLLAGDHHQLPPTILSEPAARRGLAISLMERQVELHGEAAVRMLCTQYRMHDLIQQWPSEQLYGGRLEAAPSVRYHRLPQLCGVRKTPNTAPTLLLIDTAGCRLTEAPPDETGSLHNDGEAVLVAAHVAALVRDGVPQSKIGVISPYKAQTVRVRAGLRERRINDVEVHSVDGFQGREKEAIVVSMVRSKKNCSLKFVADERRINVAVTRARRQLVIVCDTKTMCRDGNMRSLIQHIRQHGEVRPARTYLNRMDAMGLLPPHPGARGY